MESVTVLNLFCCGFGTSSVLGTLRNPTLQEFGERARLHQSHFWTNDWRHYSFFIEEYLALEASEATPRRDLPEREVTFAVDVRHARPSRF